MTLFIPGKSPTHLFMMKQNSKIDFEKFQPKTYTSYLNLETFYISIIKVPYIDLKVQTHFYDFSSIKIDAFTI